MVYASKQTLLELDVAKQTMQSRLQKDKIRYFDVQYRHRF